jgi:hypothetical protein
VTSFTANAIAYLESITAFFIRYIVSVAIQTYFSLMGILQAHILRNPEGFFTEQDVVCITMAVQSTPYNIFVLQNGRGRSGANRTMAHARSASGDTQVRILCVLRQHFSLHYPGKQYACH